MSNTDVLAASPTADGPPWLSLPAELGGALRPRLPEVVDDILRAVPRDVPGYAADLQGPLREGVRLGVLMALNRFLDLPGTSLPALASTDLAMYARLGRQEMRRRRPLEALLSAYRSAARLTFRGVSLAAQDQGYPSGVLIALGESIFAYVDELSAASVEGYASAQSEQAGEREQRRGDVAQMLLRGEVDPDALARAAALADWPVPERMLAVVLPSERIDGLRMALGPACLLVARTADAVALVPAPIDATASTWLERTLADRAAVVGPVRPWQKVAESLRLALAAAPLRTTAGLTCSAGGADALRPLWVSHHLAEVIVRSERSAMEDLAAIRLAPLAALRTGTRERMAETLLAWLRHRGHRSAIATELSIHSQTVGYRLTQLRELFGGDLDDPQVRFELELVLRAGHS